MKVEKTPIKSLLRKFVEKVNLPRIVIANNFKKCPFAKKQMGMISDDLTEFCATWIFYLMAVCCNIRNLFETHRNAA